MFEVEVSFGGKAYLTRDGKQVEVEALSEMEKSAAIAVLLEKVEYLDEIRNDLRGCLSS